LHEDWILLLRLASDRGAWAGKYNGVGGHIEQGEDPTSAARREIFEETGMNPVSMVLCGVVMIDTGRDPGINLYIYVGEMEDKPSSRPNKEGSLHWVKLSEVHNLPTVEDLPILLPRALDAHHIKKPFSGRYAYDGDGTLNIQFSS
jgi:8-oxo-dGTP diphosphatase